MFGFVYMLQFIILIATNFDFNDVSYLSIATLTVNIAFTIMLIPMFQHVSNSIISELIEEQKFAYRRENQFKKMFDSL